MGSRAGNIHSEGGQNSGYAIANQGAILSRRRSYPITFSDAIGSNAIGSAGGG